MVFGNYDEALKQLLIADNKAAETIIEFINTIPSDFVRQIQIGKLKSGYLDRNDHLYKFFINENLDLALEVKSIGYINRHYQIELKHKNSDAFENKHGNNAYFATFYQLEQHNPNFELYDKDFETKTTNHFVENHYEFYIIRESAPQIDVVINNEETISYPAIKDFSLFKKLEKRMIAKLEDNQLSQ